MRKIGLSLGVSLLLALSLGAQDMVPVHGNYEILFGGSSADDDLKKLSYRF